jgi:VanZ family protein
MRTRKHFELRAAARRGFLYAVAKLKLFAKYWLPVVLWAAVIFSASGDKKSVQRSSRLIEPFVRWLLPDISEEGVQTTVFVVRKCAHVTEFAILALLLRWALRRTLWQAQAGWVPRAAGSAWLGAVLFAVTDEWHQVYVPGRQGSVWDVVIDSVGAAGGLFALWLLGRWQKKW